MRWTRHVGLGSMGQPSVLLSLKIHHPKIKKFSVLKTLDLIFCQVWLHSIDFMDVVSIFHICVLPRCNTFHADMIASDNGDYNVCCWRFIGSGSSCLPHPCNPKCDEFSWYKIFTFSGRGASFICLDFYESRLVVMWELCRIQAFQIYNRFFTLCQISTRVCAHCVGVIDLIQRS